MVFLVNGRHPRPWTLLITPTRHAVCAPSCCYRALVKLAFLSDIHLNFIARGTAERFLEKVGRRADAIAVGGDIHEAPELSSVLIRMAEVLKRPTYFVLSNHD